MLASIIAMWAAIFSCHALAFRAGSPILALLPPIAMLAFADTVLEEFIKPVYGVVFLAAVARDRLRRRAPPGAGMGPGLDGSGVPGAPVRHGQPGCQARRGRRRWAPR